MKALRRKINPRVLAVLLSLPAGALFIALGTVLLEGTDWHEILFGGAGKEPAAGSAGGGASQQNASRSEIESILSFPLTIQNLMWLMFFIGCGEIWVRVVQAGQDLMPINDRLLPEDPEMMLRARDLGPIYRRVKEGDYAEHAFLPRLIMRAILQFQSSRSVDQANALLNSTLELCQHEIELRYNMLRYLVWLIPTLGFIGTVIGIAFALKIAGGVDFGNQTEMQGLMPQMTTALGVAFYTTLLALLQSAVLVFALHIAQAREEGVLNRAGQYCLDNLINRLYEK